MASSSSLKSERSRKINERDTLSNRKAAVDRITYRISSEIDNYIIHVNNMVSMCSSMYSSGIKGKKKGITDDIQQEMEKYCSSDIKVSGSKSKLEEESSRCQIKINTLNLEISTLDNQIREAEYREAEEQRKAWEEYLASLSGGDRE